MNNETSATKSKKNGFWKRIISDSHEFVITFCIMVVFFGFLTCTFAILYTILSDAKADSSLIEFFDEYDDLVKMVLTYIFTRWQLTKSVDKEKDDVKP